MQSSIFYLHLCFTVHQTCYIVLLVNLRKNQMTIHKKNLAFSHIEAQATVVRNHSSVSTLLSTRLMGPSSTYECTNHLVSCPIHEGTINPRSWLIHEGTNQPVSWLIHEDTNLPISYIIHEGKNQPMFGPDMKAQISQCLCPYIKTQISKSLGPYIKEQFNQCPVQA